MNEGTLIDFIESVSGGAHLRVEENLGRGFVRLRISEAERRQAKHDIRCVEDIVIELLRNARDANASSIFIATTKEGNVRYLTIIDDGDGVPSELQQLIFEPRVTSKLETMVMDDWGVHGRGMALYSIKCNVEEAHVACSGAQMGSSFHVRVNTDELTEKTDQSSFPVLEKDEEGSLRVSRGPHNIIRAALEFSLANKQGLTIYLGSPAEITATLVDYGHRNLSSDKLLFIDDISTLPICERLAASADANELMNQAQILGLSLSERTAHRILSGQIEPLRSVLRGVVPEKGKIASAPDLFKDNRGLKLAREDVETFSREMEKAFEILAQRYYISLKDIPKVTVKGDTITVRFSIDKEL